MNILGRARRQRVAKVSIFIITLLLIMEMAGCAPVIRYDLNITSTKGGSVITPGEGTFTYNQGKVVRLVARSALGYTFVKWTGDVATIADVRSFSTTITMDANYTITANFGCAC
ncbi:MAG: InlB B-repeat-containing protein [Dehalococcoidia bacterium]